MDTWNGVLTGYEVAFKEMSATDSDVWLTQPVNSPSNNSITINKLSLSVTYEIKVRTVNNVGFSDYSPPITLFTELGLSVVYFAVALTEVRYRHHHRHHHCLLQ